MRKLFLKGLGFFTALLLISFVLRFYFFSFAQSQFVNESTTDILIGFLHGVRFDIAALFYVNILFFLILYFGWARENKLVAVKFSALNSIYVGMLAADVDFYLSYGKKVDLKFLTAVEGTKANTLFVMFGVYKHVFLMMIFAGVLFYGLYRFWWAKQTVQGSIKKYPVYLLGVLVLCILGVRGGLQKRVLGGQHTLLYANGSSSLMHLTSNTVHNLIRGKDQEVFPKVYMPGELQEVDLARWDFKKLGLRKSPKNVLFVFVESLSSYAVQKDGLLKDLKDDFGKDAISIDEFYANGRLSMDAIVSNFFGVPSHFELHLFNSKYVQNRWVGLSTVLKQEGFESFFIHGASEGTQFFDVITGASGIEDFYSVRDNYDIPKDMKAKWGVHDEFLYEKTLSIVKGYEKPFVGALFTTSSHSPFKGTPNNREGLGDIEKDYFASLKYANKALIDFFESVKKEPWYNDTLFIVLGDHGPPILTDWNMSLEYDSKIPLIMYLPGSNLSEVQHRKVSQHVDLPMTIFHMLDVKPEKWSSFGYSLFDTEIETPVFYTGSGKRGLTMITSSTEKYTSAVKSDQDPKWQKVEAAIKDYVYRLETDSL